MVVVPGDTPVTIPVALTFATLVFEDVQGLTEEGVPEPDNCELLDPQTLNVPVITGKANTLKDTVAEHPAEFVYVMLVEPIPTPVTTPVLETVATPVLEDVHGIVDDGVPVPLNVTELFRQTELPPVIVGGVTTLMVTASV